MLHIFRGAAAALVWAVTANGAHAAPCGGTKTSGSFIESGTPLTLASVIREVRRASPAVIAEALEANALGAEADQTARPWNPSVTLELENFSGSGALAGFDQTETTVAVEQTFRLGGKRVLGERAARARQALATAECTVILREAELQAALLFIDLLAAYELRELATESADLSDKLAMTVARRVDAGAAAPPELSRARADAATLRANAAGVQAEIDVRRYALASLWGDSDPQFGAPVSEQVARSTGPENSVSGNPRLNAADAAQRARDAETALARSAALPDVTVSAGFRRFEDTGDEAFVTGVSVPLPLFDRGKDQVRASSVRADAASLNRRVVEQRLLSEQRSAVAARRAAQSRLDILVGEALPEAESAYSSAERGYEVGRFDLATTLDARAVLLETQLAVIEAERAVLSEDFRLRALIGAAPFDGGL
ncbi:MAG: TolC family protein [Pseudomonadota bacterium]